MAKTNQLYNRVNVFLSNLALLNVKVHNLHWNVEGREFKIIHELTERIYKMLQQQFDEVAEVLKMQGQMPLGSIAEYMKNATIKEIPSCNYSVREVLEFLDEDCQNISDLAEDIRDQADDEDNYIIANLLEDYLALYAKTSWMIKAMLAAPEEN